MSIPIAQTGLQDLSKQPMIRDYSILAPARLVAWEVGRFEALRPGALRGLLVLQLYRRNLCVSELKKSNLMLVVVICASWQCRAAMTQK